MIEPQPQLDTNEWSTITNALRVAAETYQGHAAEFRKITKENQPLMMSFEAAQEMARRFDEQAKEALELMEEIAEEVGY